MLMFISATPIPALASMDGTFENGITSIGDKVFFNCINSESIYIPDSVTYIGGDSLKNCDILKIFAKPGTYAEKYSLAKEIPFLSAAEAADKKMKVTPYENAVNYYFDVTVEDCTGGTILAALYNSDNIPVEIKTSLISDYDITTVSVPKTDSAAYAKLFAWDGMKPLSESDSISLNFSDTPISDDKTLTYSKSITHTVGKNLIDNSTITLGSGWSGDISQGFTHTPGYTDSIIFATDASESGTYIIEFDVTNPGEGKLSVSFGDSPAADPYCGLEHCIIGFNGSAQSLVITPICSYETTLKNIKCRRIDVNGTDSVEVSTKNVGFENEKNITGFWNIGIGDENTMKSSVNATRCIGIGYCALRDLQSGTRNIGIGTFSMSKLLDGHRNIAIGSDSLWLAEKADDCVVVGKSAHQYGDGAQYNVAVGGAAMANNNENAQKNVAVGYRAANYCNDNNVAVGYMANYWSKGDNNVAIGSESGASWGAQTADNSIAIGSGVQYTKSNQIVLGNSSVTEFIVAGKKIIFNKDGTVTWEALK